MIGDEQLVEDGREQERKAEQQAKSSAEFLSSRFFSSRFFSSQVPPTILPDTPSGMEPGIRRTRS